MADRSYFPLTETTYLILLSLAPGARHGYAIRKDVQAPSGGRIHLSTGTLYGALKRLLELAWIARIQDPLLNRSDRKRKAYALTSRGRRALEAEAARLKNLVTKASLRAVGETT